MSGEVYLDHAATSWPKPPVVLEAIADFFANAGGNTGRSGHRRSIASSRAVSLARERLADLLGAETPDELIFTKNATEALNLAIYGLAADGGAHRHHVARAQLGDAAAARTSSRRGRCTLAVVRADGQTGAIDLDEWAAAAARIRPVPGGRSTHASNVTGAVLPLAEMAAVANEADVPLVVDASQTAGPHPVRPAGARREPRSPCPATRACSARPARGCSTSRRASRSSR